MLSLHALIAFKDNYVWALSNADGKSVVVDPGQAGPVLQAASQGIIPVAILLTHHHPDHIGGVRELLSRFDIPCYAPVDSRISEATHRVGDGDRVTIEDLGVGFDVLAVPGHTLSHVAYHGAGYLFSGDTLFSLGCGRLFEGSPGQMLESLDRLAALPGETLMCCGHEYTQNNGYFAVAAEPENPQRDERLIEVAQARQRGVPTVPSSIASERACNPFLRIDQPTVRTTLRSRGFSGEDRVQAFAELRSWKDAFVA